MLLTFYACLSDILYILVHAWPPHKTMGEIIAPILHADASPARVIGSFGS